MNSLFADHLLDWYHQYARVLPWRNHPDPYVVWVSEIMLQQTRVDTVIPYFLRWMEQFPDLHTLAESPEQAVLKNWEGLGYYSRARNLHKAAQILVKDNRSQIPPTRTELEKLPGIGPYTAGAIASMAFGMDEAALDGNIRRVLARYFNVAVPARSPVGENTLWNLARENLPKGQAGDYNQAMMDLGASICLAKNPQCLLCPLKQDCLANQLGLQAERPVMSPARKPPHYIVTAAVIERNAKILIARRPADGLLGNMWEFPGGKLEDGESLPECLIREIREELNADIDVGEKIGVFKHAYTHFRVTLHAFYATLTQGEPSPIEASQLGWVSIKELDQYPMGKIDRMISEKLKLKIV